MRRPNLPIILCSGLVLLLGGMPMLYSEPASRHEEPVLRPTDQRLEELVLAALAADPEVNSFELVVTVFEGAAILNGSVDTEAERTRAELVAEQVEGVTEVDNRINVDRPALTPDRSDAQIQRQIIDAAEIFPLANIEVNVHDGLATLTGTVPSDEIRRKLTQIAFKKGALLVKNQVRVAPE